MAVTMSTYESLTTAFREAFDKALDTNNAAHKAIWNLRDAADALAAEIIIEADPPAPEPIKDVRVYVESRSRSGISHAVTVTNGKLRCTCEDATYRPLSGPCWHAERSIAWGDVDHRAVWDGGLNGLPSDSHSEALAELLSALS